MKFIVDKNIFQTTVGKIQGIVEKRSTIPILSNVLISGEDKKIKLIATDLEIGIQETIAAKSSDKGEICIPARKVYDIVREISDDQIEIEGGDNFWVKIKGGKTTFNLPGLDPSEFPSFPSVEGVTSFTIVAQDLQEMIEKTIFAASPEESRFNLNGIYIERLEKEGKSLFRMVATDGHRLSLVDKEMESTIEKGIVISRRGLSELRKVLGNGDSTVEISQKENNSIFKTENMTVVIRLLEGEYPDYQQVIPKDNDKKVEVNRKDFIATLRRAHVIASEKGEGVKFLIKSGSMEISSGGPDVGNVQEEIKIDYTGDALEVSFNARYLLDVLNIIDSEKVSIELKEELQSGLLRPVNEEEYVYVIMPMRI